MPSRRTGVWIDHRRAVIVRLDGDEPVVEDVASDVEPRVRMAGGSRSSTPFGPQGIASETGRDRRHAKHLREYYERVAERIGDATAILLLGPGEAKHELLDVISGIARFDGTPTEVETVDKLTRAQIVARVRAHFGVDSRRKLSP
jgi:hypothetical protein